MPPRKKAKASAASTPLGDTQPQTPQASGPVNSQDDLPNDPWADEQETQLFKSMMKWKPTGMYFYLQAYMSSTDQSRPPQALSHD
jgi:MRG-binding protein